MFFKHKMYYGAEGDLQPSNARSLQLPDDVLKYGDFSNVRLLVKTIAGASVMDLRAKLDSPAARCQFAVNTPPVYRRSPGDHTTFELWRGFARDNTAWITLELLESWIATASTYYARIEIPITCRGWLPEWTGYTPKAIARLRKRRGVS